MLSWLGVRYPLNKGNYNVQTRANKTAEIAIVCNLQKMNRNPQYYVLNWNYYENEYVYFLEYICTL